MITQCNVAGNQLEYIVIGTAYIDCEIYFLNSIDLSF